jgi:hypothetical protein
MEIFIVVVVALVGLYFWHKRSTKVMADRDASVLAEVNVKNGTRFSLSRPELVMTESPPGVAVQPNRWVFDPDARKICILGFMGKTAEVIDFSYIRSFKVEYEEVLRVQHYQTIATSEGKVDRRSYKIVFSTTDLKRPTLEVLFSHAEQAAKTWGQRLEIILAEAGSSRAQV